MLKIVKSIKEKFSIFSPSKTQHGEEKTVDEVSMRVLNSPLMEMQRQNASTLQEQIRHLKEDQKSLIKKIESVTTFVNKKLDTQTQDYRSVFNEPQTNEFFEKIINFKKRKNEIDNEITRLKIEHKEIEDNLTKTQNHKPTLETESQINFFWSENNPEMRTICRQAEIQKRILEIENEKITIDQQLNKLMLQLKMLKGSLQEQINNNSKTLELLNRSLTSLKEEIHGFIEISPDESWDLC